MLLLAPPRRTGAWGGPGTLQPIPEPGSLHGRRSFSQQLPRGASAGRGGWRVAPCTRGRLVGSAVEQRGGEARAGAGSGEQLQRHALGLPLGQDDVFWCHSGVCARSGSRPVREETLQQAVKHRVV